MKQKILALLLAPLVVLSLTLGVAAAPPQKISALHSQFAQQLQIVELDGGEIPPSSLSALDVYSGSELRIYLLGGGEDQRLFYDQNGEPIPTADISLSRLRAGQVSVNCDEHEAVIRSVSLAYSNKAGSLPTAAPYIRVEFAPEFFSVEDVAFSAVLSLSLAGEEQLQTRLELAGAIRTKVVEVSGEDTAIDIQDGSVLLATENIPSISLALGDGVSVHTRLQAGRKYYAAAHLQAEETVEASANTPAKILRIYSLEDIGLDRRGTTVLIDSEVPMYVYGADGGYLGTTRTRLPYSPQYSLSNRKVTSFLP